MDAVARMGRIIKETAHLTREQEGLGCAQLVVFCNAVEDNPFMAGAFHGVGEALSLIHISRCRSAAPSPGRRRGGGGGNSAASG